jgi:hypothetical protein
MTIHLAVWILLLVIIVAPRIPFLANYLLGEEGCFAFLVANPVRSSVLATEPSAIVGNIDGKYLLVDFQHTIIPYYIMETGLGSVLRRINVLSLDFENRTRVVRAGFLLFFMIGSSGLLYLSARVLTSPGAWTWKLLVAAMPAYVLTTPLAFGASTQAQMDGGVGVLLAGLAAWLLVSAENKPNDFLGLLLAGFLLGIGRVEWALATLAVLCLVTAFGFFARTPAYRASGFVALGMIIGVGISAMLSFSEFVASFRIMGRIFSPSTVFAVAKQLLPFTTPLIILLSVAMVLSFAHRAWLLRQRPGIALSLGISAALFVGFTISGYATDGFPRYFAPALIMNAFALIALLIHAPIRWKNVGAVAGGLLLLFGLVQNFSYLDDAHRRQVSIASDPGWSYAYEMKIYRNSADLVSKSGAVVLEQPAFWLYFPTASWVSTTIPLEYVKASHPEVIKRLRNRGGTP